LFDQLRHAIECNATVIADDASTPVCVRESGKDVRAAAAPDVHRVSVEDAVVVRLSILGKSFDDVRVRFVPVGLQRAEDHAKAAVGHDGALEWRFGLQADDYFVLTIDIAWRVCSYSTRDLRNVEHAFLSFLDKE